MSNAYRDLTHLVERLHRRLLDVVRAELTRADINDLNGVQALLLVNVGTALAGLSDVETIGEALKRLEFIWTEDLGRSGR